MYHLLIFDIVQVNHVYVTLFFEIDAMESLNPFAIVLL